VIQPCAADSGGRHAPLFASPRVALRQNLPGAQARQEDLDSMPPMIITAASLILIAPRHPPEERGNRVDPSRVNAGRAPRCTISIKFAIGSPYPQHPRPYLSFPIIRGADFGIPEPSLPLAHHKGRPETNTDSGNDDPGGNLDEPTPQPKRRRVARQIVPRDQGVSTSIPLRAVCQHHADDDARAEHQCLTKWRQRRSGPVPAPKTTIRRIGWARSRLH
jgi:hypothetical protein